MVNVHISYFSEIVSDIDLYNFRKDNLKFKRLIQNYSGKRS